MPHDRSIRVDRLDIERLVQPVLSRDVQRAILNPADGRVARRLEGVALDELAVDEVSEEMG